VQLNSKTEDQALLRENIIFAKETSFNLAQILGSVKSEPFQLEQRSGFRCSQNPRQKQHFKLTILIIAGCHPAVHIHAVPSLSTFPSVGAFLSIMVPIRVIDSKVVLRYII